jgi:hypothetical protein
MEFQVSFIYESYVLTIYIVTISLKEALEIAISENTRLMKVQIENSEKKKRIFLLFQRLLYLL